MQALAGSVPRADLRQAYGAQVAAETLLDAAPPRALVLTSYYQSGFAVWAARAIAGARPDLDHVHRTYLGQPGYVENLLARAPHLAPLLRGVDRPAALDAARLAPELARRAVLYEYDDDTIGDDLVRDSVPRGVWRELLPAGDPRARVRRDAADVARALAPLERRLAPHRDDPLTRTWLLWTYYLNARYHLRRHDCAAARYGWSQAVELGSRRDPFLREIERRCRF